MTMEMKGGCSRLLNTCGSRAMQYTRGTADPVPMQNLAFSSFEPLSTTQQKRSKPAIFGIMLVDIYFFDPKWIT